MHKLILSFKDKIQKVLIAQGPSCRIGRAAECDICIDNLAVEAHHASVQFEGERAYLSIPDPNNSVLINGRKLNADARTELGRGDEIQIGKHVLTYTWERQQVSSGEPPAKPQQRSQSTHAWLQFLSGPKMGRTLQLNKPSLQIETANHRVALISNRKDGYYLSTLDTDTSIKVDNQDIGDNIIPLQDGNTIRVGDMEMLFFTQNLS